jgi:23S rRNA U2552 (ribose-2'-O)-methylase RlmE/FtsJ
MSYFLLPEIHNKNISVNIANNSNNKLYISKTLNGYLNNIKKQIDDNSESWDHIKKYTNPYEFIHTIIPNSKHSISKMKPLSRSYYKMIEISNLLHLHDDFKGININTFHLAEGPGGFIEAMANIRSNPNDKYYGMTLIDSTDPNVPGWKKTSHFLETHKNVEIEYGPSKNGDLLNIDNLKYCREKHNNSMNIITADGGFDFSNDFNKQEILATNLLIAQVSFAISMQKINGHFILKIFDIFSKTTCDILYLLSCMYKQVFIMKPNTSRLANSEKYIVCKYFKGNNTIIDSIISQYHKLNENEYISSIFDFNIDLYYLNKIEEYNAILGQQQIENIASTINLISFNNKIEKLETLKKNNVFKCIQWCEKFNISCNKTISTNNIFIN